jgi:hypothetical protein
MGAQGVSNDALVPAHRTLHSRTLERLKTKAC